MPPCAGVLSPGGGGDRRSSPRADFEYLMGVRESEGGGRSSWGTGEADGGSHDGKESGSETATVVRVLRMPRRLLPMLRLLLGRQGVLRHLSYEV